MAALWALVVVVYKQVLAVVTPTAVNFLVRLTAIAGLLLITVPLTALSLWSNGFGINSVAAGWIALSAVATWLIAFSAYYVALRGERIAVIAPITSTDPLWTALFAWLILGSAFGRATLAGMLVTMAGVVLISRSARRGDRDEVAADLATTGALAGAAHGDVLPSGWNSLPPPSTGETQPGTHAATEPTSAATASRARLIGLAVLAAAGWGLGPICIDKAAGAYGHVTATMMLLSQVLGALMLGGVLLVRRAPITARPTTREARRRAMRLIMLAGLLEACVSVLFYLSIVAIGPVLTMLIMATTPVFSILFGVVLLRERPGLGLSLAAAVTVSGVLIATLDGII